MKAAAAILAGMTSNRRAPVADPATGELHLDLKGLKCPMPALRTRKALATAMPGTRLVVECTDPMSVIDIPHLAAETGNTFEGRTLEDGVITFRLRKTNA
ncbi:sulfurtransferase TusA family protein [Azorhizobium doebereinerae]|uniref:sulfurtransferase TusA family protein n=1 Tax=Azorhizobium doebereinerae TaxID=281091 RepID=UPI003CC9154D